MDVKKIQDFSNSFEGFAKWDPKKQADYFAYFLTSDKSITHFTAKQLSDCFQLLDLKTYARLPAYLSEHANKKSGRYIKMKHAGYRLERSVFDEIAKVMNDEPERVRVSTQLTDLVDQVSGQEEKDFLLEALSCLRVRAYRATITMVWIVAMHHLHKRIFTSRLNEFNVALTKNPDKKVKKIVSIDDFSDLPESSFIELTRAAKIITNDVRKILIEKLGTRNSAAHPSLVVITGHKATEFVSDLLINVILKH